MVYDGLGFIHSKPPFSDLRYPSLPPSSWPSEDWAECHVRGRATASSHTSEKRGDEVMVNGRDSW